MLALPVQPKVAAPSVEETWLASTAAKCIRFHESTNRYKIVNPPYSGAWQFLGSTWRATTGLPGIAADYSPAVQDHAAYRLFLQRGWQPWSTRYVCRLR